MKKCDKPITSGPGARLIASMITAHTAAYRRRFAPTFVAGGDKDIA